MDFLPDKHLSEPIFEASKNSFVGVYSYFSQEHMSYSLVKASEKSTLFYFDKDPHSLDLNEEGAFLDFLFDMVVIELRQRQQFAAQVAYERQDFMNKLIKTEKLATAWSAFRRTRT